MPMGAAASPNLAMRLQLARREAARALARAERPAAVLHQPRLTTHYARVTSHSTRLQLPTSHFQLSHAFAAGPRIPARLCLAPVNL